MQETTDDVACCNCCEDGSFFEEYKDEETLEMEADPCIGCEFEGQGSEHCIAVIGDYCRAADGYIEETEEDKRFLEGKVHG